MAQESALQFNGRILEWRTKVPSSGEFLFDSPTFRLMGSEWYLNFSFFPQQEGVILFYQSDNAVCLDLRVSKGEQEPLHFGRTFSVVTYLGHPTDRSQTPVAWKWCQIAERKPIEIWRITSNTGDYNNFRSLSNESEVRIVCLFYGDGHSSGKLVEKSVQVSQEVPRDVESLSSDLSHLLQKEILADVRLECGGRTFQAHRSVLGARSEVFRAMFQNETLESATGAVKVQDVDAEVLQNLLKFVYTGLLEVTCESTAADLYVAADKYDVLSLKAACTYWIERNLNAENSLKYLVLADSHSDADLKATALSFIFENPSVLKSDEWRAMASSDLAIEVFQAYIDATVK